MSKKDDKKKSSVKKVATEEEVQETQEVDTQSQEETLVTIELSNTSDLYEEIHYQGDTSMLMSQSKMTLEVEGSKVDDLISYFKQTNPNVIINKVG